MTLQNNTACATSLLHCSTSFFYRQTSLRPPYVKCFYGCMTTDGELCFAGTCFSPSDNNASVGKTQPKLAQFIIAAAKRQDFRKAGDLCPKAVEMRGTGGVGYHLTSRQGRPSAGLLHSLLPSLPHETCSAFSDKPMGKLPPEFLFHIQCGPRATERLQKKKGVHRVNRPTLEHRARGGCVRTHAVPPRAHL